MVMKLLYITNDRIPTNWANAIQIIKTCESLSKCGLSVELVIPFQRKMYIQNTKTNIWDYYDVTEKFNITRIHSINLRVYEESRFFYRLLPAWLRYILYRIQDISFGFSTSLYAPFKKADVYYSRSFFCLVIPTLLKKQVIYESHEMPRHKLSKKLSLWLFKRITGLVVVSSILKEHYIKEGIPERKILVAENGVDLKVFKIINQLDARKELNIPKDKKIICYTGALSEWKGIFILANSMKLLPEYLLYVVGGNELQQKKYLEFIQKRGLANIVVVGQVEPSLIPLYLAASDVVVLPNILTDNEAWYTSPLKLFEYLSSGKPIVATDTIPMVDILNNQNAMLVAPDNVHELANGIKRVIEDKEFARRIVNKAQVVVKNYTWGKRAKKILDFINKICEVNRNLSKDRFQ